MRKQIILRTASATGSWKCRIWAFCFLYLMTEVQISTDFSIIPKNAEQLRSTFVDELFGCVTPLSAGGQRDSFNALVEETLGDDCAYDTVMNIHEKLNEWVETQKTLRNRLY